MSPNFFKKPQEPIEPTSANGPEAPEEKIYPGVETLRELDKEKLRQEVLKEVERAEKPTGKTSVTLISATAAMSAVTQKSEILTQLERILEEDLQAVYFKMEPVIQKKFHDQGEATARKIEKILLGTKIKAQNIFKLLVEWLKMIPGVNKFFIRQEAKIKTNKILDLKK